MSVEVHNGLLEAFDRRARRGARVAIIIAIGWTVLVVAALSGLAFRLQDAVDENVKLREACGVGP